MKTITISRNEAGQRLDKMLAKYLNQAPKGFVYKMLRKKNITLNGKKADGSEKLKESDAVALYLSDETLAKFGKELGASSNLKVGVLYEDDDVIVVNKPVGALSQKAREGDSSLVEWLASYLLDAGELDQEGLRSFHPAVCNRLDRNTSGVVVAGKSIVGLQTVCEAFRNRSVEKYYLCVAKGELESGKSLKGYLYKDADENRVEIADQAGRGTDFVQMEYEPVQRLEGFTLLQVKLITGKTHQIRAHLAKIGHPILGDPKYGDEETNQRYREQCGIRHQLLHAARIVFPKEMKALPNLSGREVSAPLPERFRKVLMVLGGE